MKFVWDQQNGSSLNFAKIPRESIKFYPMKIKIMLKLYFNDIHSSRLDHTTWRANEKNQYILLRKWPLKYILYYHKCKLSQGTMLILCLKISAITLSKDVCNVSNAMHAKILILIIHLSNSKANVSHSVYLPKKTALDGYFPSSGHSPEQ